MASASGFGYLSSGAGPGSSHAIGMSAPFTVWAVVPLSRGGRIIILTKTIGIQPVGLDP